MLVQVVLLLFSILHSCAALNCLKFPKLFLYINSVIRVTSTMYFIVLRSSCMHALIYALVSTPLPYIPCYVGSSNRSADLKLAYKVYPFLSLIVWSSLELTSMFSCTCNSCLSTVSILLGLCPFSKDPIKSQHTDRYTKG